MTSDSNTGGEPTTLGRCVSCGETYPVHEVEGGEYHPIGTDGTCACGNAVFEVVDAR